MISSQIFRQLIIIKLKYDEFKDIDQWKQIDNPERFKSRQWNDKDCGIHASIVMEQLVKDPSSIIDHQESEIPLYRQQLCLRILNFSDSL